MLLLHKYMCCVLYSILNSTRTLHYHGLDMNDFDKSKGWTTLGTCGMQFAGQLRSECEDKSRSIHKLIQTLYTNPLDPTLAHV